MTKGKRQTAADLMSRYEAETVGFSTAVNNSIEPAKKADSLLESLRRNLNRVVMIPINILVIEENVRRSVDEASPEFLGLVDSVKENGVRQNVIVDLQDEAEANYKVVVIAGQRRILAAKAAGVKQVAALILRL